MAPRLSKIAMPTTPKGKSPVKPAPRKAASKPAPVPKGKKTKTVEEVADAGSADEPTNKRRRATSNASSGPPKKITKAAQKAKEVQAKKALGKDVREANKKAMAEEDASMVRAKRSTRQANTPQDEVDENSLVNRFRSMGKAHATPQPIVQEEEDDEDDENNDGGGRGANTYDSDASSGINAGEAGDAQDDDINPFEEHTGPDDAGLRGAADSDQDPVDDDDDNNVQEAEEQGVDIFANDTISGDVDVANPAKKTSTSVKAMGTAKAARMAVPNDTNTDDVASFYDAHASGKSNPFKGKAKDITKGAWKRLRAYILVIQGFPAVSIQRSICEVQIQASVDEDSRLGSFYAGLEPKFRDIMYDYIWKAVASVRGAYKLHAATVVDQEYGLTNMNPLDRRGYAKWLLGDTSKDHIEVFLHSPAAAYQQSGGPWISAYNASVANRDVPTWDGQSIYLNPVFHALIQEFCFKKGREPDALNFMEDFEDFPLALYAMTVTVVENRIREYANSGVRELVQLRGAFYKTRYEHHLSKMQYVNKESGDWLSYSLKKLYEKTLKECNLKRPVSTSEEASTSVTVVGVDFEALRNAARD